MSNDLESINTLKRPAQRPAATHQPASKLSTAPPAVRPATVASFSAEDDDEEEEKGFWRRYGLALALGAAVMGGIIFMAGKLSSDKASAPRKAPELPIVKIQLPPPPPPPPPPPQTPPEQKMIEQTPIEQEEKPEPKAADEPPAPTTNNVGSGPADSYGLGPARGGGNTIGGSTGGGGSSKFGWYASQVQSRIADALRKNSRTRTANLSVQARIWADASGRVTRAQLSGSSGNPAVDEALKNEVLSGLQLQEPPPAGMPMPIVLRLSARRAN